MQFSGNWLSVHAEHIIQSVLIIKIRGLAERTPGDIVHGIQPHGFQLFRVTRAHPPKIREGTMILKFLPVTHFIQFRDPHTILIRWHMLCPHIHGYLRQIQIGADASGGGDVRCFQNVKDDLHHKIMRGNVKAAQIVCRDNKDFINRIDMYIVWRDIFQIDFVSGFLQSVAL